MKTSKKQRGTSIVSSFLHVLAFCQITGPELLLIFTGWLSLFFSNPLKTEQIILYKVERS